MPVSKPALYILVEGSDNSPELAFFKRAIRKILTDKGLSIIPNIIEVGSSSAFTPYAGLGYRYSSIHQLLPVLAIADSDYRTHLNKQSEANHKLISTKKPKIRYWKRHEWENYLLEETDYLATWINQIPVRKETSNTTRAKCYRKFEKPASPIRLDNCLEQYFRQSVKAEYWECLKFNLAIQIKKYPSIEKPVDFDHKTLNQVKEWFFLEAFKSERVVKLKPKPPHLFDDIMTEIPWETWLNKPHLIQFEQAKQRFRGKEAFNQLCQCIQTEFGVHNFGKELLIQEMLGNLATNTSSTIFMDLQNLLLSELANVG
ncbi:MAG: hypothetical protein DRR19_14700 [Candidatus Parabeggiatoa sp. nov. 1]|nr:MAG: hypothetical protein DRR19_14700 [Gammaproteobacteria bacterium]